MGRDMVSPHEVSKGISYAQGAALRSLALGIFPYCIFGTHVQVDFGGCQAVVAQEHLESAGADAFLYAVDCEGVP